MSVWFTSDLHLGHIRCAQLRGFDSPQEHDFRITENINSVVNKRDKLFILGDLAFTQRGLDWVNSIQCANIELIMGNHDKYPIAKYLQYVQKVHGFYRYKNLWISHCPIHPNEIYRAAGNLHGHVHQFSNSERIGDPRYFNVNIDMNNLMPVSFDYIQARYSKL